MDRIAGANTWKVEWSMDYGDTERKHFHIFFPFHASITIGIIFLITYRVNKQFILQTKV